MKHITLLLLMAYCLFFSGSLYGQKSYRNGYIIKNNGDTLNGLIQFEQRNSTSSKVNFKRFDIAIPILYKPNEIKAYGYKKGRHFESKEIDGKMVFAECLVMGKVSLFALGRKLFIQKGDFVFVELKSGHVTHKTSEGQYEYRNYVDLLEKITSDAQNFEIPQNIQLANNDIIQVVSNYNQHINSTYFVYQKDDEVLASQSFAFTEYKTSRYGIIGSFNLNPSSIAITSSYYIENTTASLLYDNLSVGFFINTKKSTTNNIAFQIEALYTQKSNYYNVKAEQIYTPKETHHIEIFSNISYLKIPASLQFEFPFRKYKPYASIGIAYSIILYNSSDGILETERLSEIYSWDVNFDKYFNSRNQTSVFASLGFKYRISSSLMLLLESRAEILSSPAVRNEKFNTSNKEHFEFMYYNTPRVLLIHKSPVISFMVGLGF